MSEDHKYPHADRALIHVVLQLTKLTICLVWFLSCANAFAEGPEIPTDPELLLQRIRSKITTHLTQLRNYTCHVVVDRVARTLSNSRLDHQDRVELDVAFVGDRELFSRPGEARFEEQPVSQIVPQGMIGNDAFGSHEDSVFSGDAASFKFAGSCKKDGHKTLRYNFRVPMESSTLLVKQGSADAMVGYTGSFWVDADTLDIVRLEWKTQNIPPSVGLSSVERSLRYKVLRIGNSDFLLPAKSELSSFDQAGTYRLNTISLDRCLEYTGEAVVTYGGPTDGAPASRSSPERPVR
jgi:hypothetical protein